MKKAQINQLMKMLESDDVKGKKLLERVLWLNTSKSKYKVGDIVKIDAPHHYIYGNKVVGFCGTITKVRANSDCKIYTYDVDVKYEYGDKTGVANVVVGDGEIKGKTKASVNRIEQKSRYVMQMDVLPVIR